MLMFDLSLLSMPPRFYHMQFFIRKCDKKKLCPAVKLQIHSILKMIHSAIANLQGSECD